MQGIGRSAAGVCGLRAQQGGPTVSAPRAAKGARESGGAAGIGSAGALRLDGLVTVRVEEDDVRRARQVYESLRRDVEGFRRCSPAFAPRSQRSARGNIIWTEEVPFRTEASGFRMEGGGLEYDIYTTGWTPTMRWVTAGDAETLGALVGTLGTRMKGELEKELGEECVINSACFVVVSGSVEPAWAKLHADWATTEIPRERVFTALTPLFDFPTGVGGLLWRPHSDPEPGMPLLRHQYRLGEGVIFDGKLMHQTEPFMMADVPDAPEGFERVLASFSFCAKSEQARPHWTHIEQVLKDQTRHFYVTPSGEKGTGREGFLPFEEARGVVQGQRLKGYPGWWKWSRSEAKPKNVPIRPDRVYKGAGWTSWADWVGYER